jgi:hypothetical protein
VYGASLNGALTRKQRRGPLAMHSGGGSDGGDGGNGGGALSPTRDARAARITAQHTSMA